MAKRGGGEEKFFNVACLPISSREMFFNYVRINNTFGI